MKKGDNTALIMTIGILVIAAIFIYPFLKTEEHTRSEKTQINAYIVSRDLSNTIKLLAGVEQGVQFYELPRNTYEIEVSPLTIRATDKDVNCEEGCSFTHEHNSKYVQAGHILPGVENICVVKKYVESGDCNAQIVYVCDAEERDLRCNCELGEIKECIDNNRFVDEGERCELELMKLDNYGEFGDENTVSMTINAKGCKNTYLSSFGTPQLLDDNDNVIDSNDYKGKRYPITENNLDQRQDLNNDGIIDDNDHNVLRYKAVYGSISDDQEKRHIKDDGPVEIIVEYTCAGINGNNFLFDIVAVPPSGDYVQDSFARIQNIIGCGEKPKPHTCVDGCEVNEEKCHPEKFGPGKFYCDRKGSIFANFCVDAYYDVNCIPI